MYTKPDWNVSWAENSVGQLFEIEKIEGDSITFKTGVHIDFSAALNPVIRPQSFVRNIGFENFYIEKKVAGGNTFKFKNAAYCWIDNIESYHTRKSHVSLHTTLACEIKNSYFHHSFSYGSGGSGYGVNCGFHTTDALVENNIFNHLRHAMLVSLGANGNVFGYNYSINNVQGNGESNLNQGWIPPDISIHGHYPFMNLFEGNDIQEIGIADYWGPAGKGNTYFRNKVNGEGIFYYDHSDYQNVVGNITTGLIDASGNSNFKLEHGNRISGNVIWDDMITDHNLPKSYYLEGKPDFFGNTEWPPFDPEIYNGNILPAQIRFEDSQVHAYVSADTSICTGDTITLKALGGTDYVWNTGETGAEIRVSPLQNQTYTVTVTLNGYSDTAQVTILINPLPEVVITTQDDYICFGDSTLLSASGGEYYLWNTGEIQKDIMVEHTGEYTVFAKDSNNCSASATIFIEQANEIIITIDSTKDIKEDQAGYIHISTNGNYVYEWSGPDDFMAISEDLDSLTQSGCYTLTILDTLADCSIDTTICIEDKTGTTDLKIEGIKIFPNPNNGVFIVDFSNISFKNAEITIYDITGKQYFRMIKRGNENILKLRFFPFASGLYIVRIKPMDNKTDDIFMSFLLIK